MAGWRATLCASRRYTIAGGRLGEIDFEWLAEFATRSLCEMYTRFKARPS